MRNHPAKILDQAEALAPSVDDADPEPYWDAVRRVHEFPNEEVFQRCVAWSARSEEHLQRLAADCLAQLGYSEGFPYREKTYSALSRLLASDSPAVVAGALSALGHLSPGPCRRQACSLATHHDADVRYSVVVALLGDDSPEAVATLILLSNDENSDVRDWATFGLGAQIDTDTADVRSALFARVNDSDSDTRAEAISGLSRRNDPRGLSALRAVLSKPDVGSLEVQAAESMPHGSLIEPLESLRAWWDVDPPLLERAIAACRAHGKVDEA